MKEYIAIPKEDLELPPQGDEGLPPLNWNKGQEYQCLVTDFEDDDTNELIIYDEKITEVGTKGFWLSSITTKENIDDFILYSELGKTVFLTKEDAERAISGDNE